MRILIFVLCSLISLRAFADNYSKFSSYSFSENKVRVSSHSLSVLSGKYIFELVDEFDINDISIPDCNEVIFPLKKCLPSVCSTKDRVIGKSYREILGKNLDGSCKYRESNAGYGSIECNIPKSELADLDYLLFVDTRRRSNKKLAKDLHTILSRNCKVMVESCERPMTLYQNFSKETYYRHFIKVKVEEFCKENSDQEYSGSLAVPLVSPREEARFLKDNEIKPMLSTKYID